MRYFALLSTFASLAAAKLELVGMAIAGPDFGCDIDGTCKTSQAIVPLQSLSGVDGAGQMAHFVKDDNLNMFRLPISWHFLTNNKGGSTLDTSAFAKYQQLVKACLDTGAYCQIDLHNFARFDNGIIGQGGPSNDEFSQLWVNIAEPWKDNNKVIFGLMNEPHDLDINTWADTCQATVTALRNSGAKDQMILLPGNNFTSAAALIENGSADALLKIKNPDGSNDNLLLDIHKYLDINNSGTHTECTTNNVDAFNDLADYLRKAGRKGMVSETGASMDQTCLKAFCEQNEAIAKNADVYLGLTGWAAGAFKQDYILTMTPTFSNGKWSDNQLFSQCIIDIWKNGPDVSPSKPSGTSSSSSASSTTATSSGQAEKDSSSESSSATKPSGEAATTTGVTSGTAVKSDVVASGTGVFAAPTGPVLAGAPMLSFARVAAAVVAVVIIMVI